MKEVLGMYIIKTQYSGNDSFNHVEYQLFKGAEKISEGTSNNLAGSTGLSRGESCLYTLEYLIDSLPNDVEVAWEHDDTLDIDAVSKKNPALNIQKDNIKRLIKKKNINFN